MKTELSTVFANFTREMWCQGVMARDQHGNQCSVHDANAVQWCALGWLMRQFEIASSCWSALIIEAKDIAETMGTETMSSSSISWANDEIGWPYIERLKDS